MSHKRDTEKRTLDALEQIRRTELSEEESTEMANRVWERLESRDGTAQAAEVGTIQGCDDYQALIPAFVAGDLAPSRTLLLEEHTRHCVPCRRALKVARNGGVAGSRVEARRSSKASAASRWLAAAALAVLAVGTGYFVMTSGPALPYGATIESTGAGLYRVDSLEKLGSGDQIAVGEGVRSAPGESSFLRLADGSLLEVKGRSELAVESARRGTTVRVDRGSVIVEAAPQDRGRLFVSTEECLVSVKGTIFAVSHGTRGSRVAVIEGEVHVDHAGAEQILLAGDRTATYADMAGYALHEELAWSQGIDRYLALLQEVTNLRQALERELPRPGLRYSSRLLDMAPDDLVFYAAFPNLVETLVEADRIVQERIGESELLREWFEQHRGNGINAHMEWTSMLSEAGGYLGEEIVVTGSLDEAGEMLGPVILAELVDAQGMRDWFTMAMAEDEGPKGSVIFLDGSEWPSASSDDTLFVWIAGDTLVASPRADVVRATVERQSSGSAGGLKGQLREIYRDGAETLVAVDAREIGATLSKTESPDDVARAEQIGVLDASHLIFQQKRFEDRTDHSAVLAFDGPRSGIASWLAEPAPMGSLRYVSPDAKLVASAVLADPTVIAEQLIELSKESDGSSGVGEFESKLDLSLRDDIAAALGGEFTLALDGPVVPEPAWKIVVEVYDPDKLIWALRKVLDAANDERAAEGRERIEWLEEQSGGRTYYGFDGQVPVRFVFDEGYMVAATNSGLVDRALRYRQSGYSIDTSADFGKLMPPDGRVNFSAFMYQNAMELLGPLAGRIAQGQLTPEQQAAIDALKGQTEPTLAYAYAEESRIVFAASGALDLLSSGLPGMIGLGGLNFDGILQHGGGHDVDETSPSPQA